jgi:hypothetical protein
VYVDGFPVLSANNYFLKGHEYVFQPVDADSGNKPSSAWRRREGFLDEPRHAASKKPKPSGGDAKAGMSEAERCRGEHNALVASARPRRRSFELASCAVMRTFSTRS